MTLSKGLNLSTSHLLIHTQGSLIMIPDTDWEAGFWAK